MARTATSRSKEAAQRANAARATATATATAAANPPIAAAAVAAVTTEEAPPAKKKARVAATPPVQPMEATVVARDGVTKLTVRMHQEFTTRIEVKEFVHDFALAQGKRAVKDTGYSSGSRFLYVCNSPTKCTFQIRGSKSMRKGVVKYVVTGFHADHGDECTGKPAITQRQVLAQLKQAAAAAERSGQPVTQTDLQELVKSVYGTSVPSRMAYRAKGAFAGETFGDATSEIQKLESLLTQFQSLNPTSAFYVDTDQAAADQSAHNAGSQTATTTTFKRAFLKLPYADHVQKSSARVLGFEGMSMGTSSSFRGGYFLELVAKDGNNDSYVLAMALCDGSGSDHSNTTSLIPTETYAWFFQCCLSCGIALDMPMFCDRSIEMLEAAALALPTGSTMLMQCTQHLIDRTAKELKLTFSKDVLKYVWQAQAVETEAEFDTVMTLLSTQNQRVADHLRSLDPVTWAKYGFVRKYPLYGWQTTTLGDAENPATLAARERGPIEFVQSYMERCMQALYMRKSDANEWFGAGQALTSFANDLLDDQRAHVASCCVSPSDGESGSGYVWDTKERTPKKRRVNISAKSCSCAYTNQMGLPCKHLVAAVQFFNARGHSWTIASLCDPMYTVQQYYEAYSQVSAVDMPVDDELVRNPNLRVKTVGLKRCSFCHEFGHNKRNCKKRLREAPPTTNDLLVQGQV
ncbi:Mutatorlike transposase, partial [Globisporangium splendens]